MNSIFESITDATLRRVYKLVLKRTIGKYLEDELLIDQLQVQSRDGKFAVHNLRLNPDLLNDEIFNRTPLKLLSLEIEELGVTISYSSLVSDGLQVDVSSINVHLCPNKNIISVGRSDSSDSTEDEDPLAGQSTTAAGIESTSEEGKEGLSFIGTWIEVIVAKLRAKIGQINIYLHPNDEPIEDSPYLKVSLKDIFFFNADPSGDMQGSSMRLSQSVMSSMHQSTTLTALSSTKVIDVGSILVTVKGDSTEEDDPVGLHISSKMVAKLRLKSEQSVSPIDLDVSITIPSLQITLEKGIIQKIVSIVLNFVPASDKLSNEAKLQESMISAIERRPKIAAKYLREIEKDILAKEKALYPSDNSKADELAGLLPQMRSLYRSARVDAPIMHSSNLFLGEEMQDTAIDSEGEFPSDDDEEFFDAQEFGTKSQFSTAFRSTFMGHSKLQNRQSAAAAKKSFIKLNVFFVKVDVTVLDKEHSDNQLSANFAESVFTVESKSTNDPQVGESMDVTVHFTTNVFELFEVDLRGQRGVSIISFSRNHDSETIYSSPDIGLLIKYVNNRPISDISGETTSVPVIDINVSFGSLVASGSVHQMGYWGKVATSLVAIDVASEPTTTKMNIAIKVPSIEFYFRSDDRIADTVWEDINTALMLEACRDNWTKLSFSKKPYLRKHLLNARGGLQFIVKELHVQIASVSGPQPSISQNVEMEKITLAIFLDAAGNSQREQLFLKSTIVTALASDELMGEKIYVKKCSDRSFGRQTHSSNGNASEKDDMGPATPYVDISRIMFIRTHKLLFEVEQREFHALMMIGDTLVVSKKDTVIVEDSLTFDVPVVPQDLEEDGSFGLQVSTAFASLSFSENAREFWDSFDFHSVPGNAAAGTMRNLVKALRDLASASSVEHTVPDSSVDSKLKLCVSIRDPKLEIYLVEHQIFVSMTADDLSVYELTPTSYKQLASEGFNFHRSKDWNGVRVGPQRHRIPFIRRAFVPVDDGKGKGVVNMGNSVLLSDHSRYGHAFEVRLCLSHEDHQFRNFAAIKSVHFFIDFYDILINHDPSSTWFFKLINIMTPQTAQQMIQNNLDDLLAQLQLYEPDWSESQRQLIEDVMSTIGLSVSDTLIASHISDTGGRKVILTPFEVTKISVRVRDSMMDYSHIEMNSRIILSVGLIALSSTIASNSDRVTLKLSLSALTFYACNEIVFDKDSVSSEISTDRMSSSVILGRDKPGSNQSQLRQWMCRNNFINLLDIDYLTNLVTLNESELDELSLRFTLGNCTIAGCYDSLVIFKDALSQWFKEFEYSCAQSEKILRKKKRKRYDVNGATLDAVPLGEGYDGELDRVRFCDELALQESESDGPMMSSYHYNKRDSNAEETIVRIPDELLQSRFPFESSVSGGAEAPSPRSSNHLHQSSLLRSRHRFGVGMEGMSLNILENFYDHRLEEDIPDYQMMRQVDAVDNTLNSGLQRSRFIEDWQVQDNDPHFEDLLEHDPDAAAFQRPLQREQPLYEADYGYSYGGNDDSASQTHSISAAFAPGVQAKMREDAMQQRDLHQSRLFAEAEEVLSESGDHPSYPEHEEDHNLSNATDNSNMALSQESSVLSAYGGGTMRLQPLKQISKPNNNDGRANNLTISRIFFGAPRHESPEPVELVSMTDREQQHQSQQTNADLLNSMEDSKISALGASQMTQSFGAQDHSMGQVDLTRSRFSSLYDEEDVEYYRQLYSEQFNPTIAPNAAAENTVDIELQSNSRSTKPTGNLAVGSNPRVPQDTDRPIPAVVQPGLSQDALRELHQLDVAWEKIDHSASQDDIFPSHHVNKQANRLQPRYTGSDGQPMNATILALSEEVRKQQHSALPFQVEQEARWYVPESQIDIKTHYIPVVSAATGRDVVSNGMTEDHRPPSERELSTKVFVQLAGNFKLRLHEGKQWQQTVTLQARNVPVGTGEAISHANVSGDRREKGGKSVSFGPAVMLDAESPKAAHLTAGDVQQVKKPALFPPAGKRSRGPNQAPSGVTQSGPSDAGSSNLMQQQQQHSKLVPLDERYSLDIFLKHIMVQVSIYDHPVALVTTGPALSSRGLRIDQMQIASTKETEAGDGWRDFDATRDEDGRTVFSITSTTQQTTTRSTAGMGTTTTQLNTLPQHLDLSTLPHERITVSVQEFLVTFGHSNATSTSNAILPNQRRKKVLGYWKSSQHPRDQAQPMVKLTLLGYRDASRTAPQLLSAAARNERGLQLSNNSSEYRVHGFALPLRLFLSDEVVRFLKQIVDENKPTSSSAGSNSTASAAAATSNAPEAKAGGEFTDAYFQQVTLAALALKIDYRASAVNLRALQQGDYLQLLNIFPIDGLEITLAAQKVQGVDGSAQLADILLRHWVHDIYANQLHRVLSGAAPLKSLSNIGKDLQGLLYIPAAQLPRTKPANSDNKNGPSTAADITRRQQSQHQHQHHRGGSASTSTSAGGQHSNQAVLRHLQKSTKTLLNTVARETLDVSHKLTMFVAQTITDLAAPESMSTSNSSNLATTVASSNGVAAIHTSSNPPGSTVTTMAATGPSNATSSSNGAVAGNTANSAARWMMEANLVQQPRGLTQGLARAYDAVSRELGVAAETIIAVPVRQYESLGPSGLITSVVRALPIAVLRPVAGIAEGLSYTILGLRNALDPETQLDEEDLWNVDLPLN